MLVSPAMAVAWTMGGSVACECEHDWVGLVDIARRVEVPRKTVVMWKLRGKLPAHRFTVSDLPAWEWADVCELVEGLAADARARSAVRASAAAEEEWFEAAKASRAG